MGYSGIPRGSFGGRGGFGARHGNSGSGGDSQGSHSSLPLEFRN